MFFIKYEIKKYGLLLIVTLLTSGLVFSGSNDQSNSNDGVEPVPPAQSRAETSATNESHFSQTDISKTLWQIVDAYTLGQKYLHQFDQILEDKSQEAMSSEIYAQLLAIRIVVEDTEETLLRQYFNSVQAIASENTSEDDKERARHDVALVNKFLSGELPTGALLEPQIKGLVLNNLLQKQEFLIKEMQELNENKEIIRHTDHMHNLKANRNIETQRFSEKEFENTFAQTQKIKRFQEFKKNIDAQGREINKQLKQLRKGVGANSLIIFPSPNSNGNVTGARFPPNTWSLTYDDGPNDSTTPQILKLLTDNKLPATFFVLMRQVKVMSKVFESIKSAKMDVASHSYTHADLSKEAANLDREIAQAKTDIEKKLGRKITLFRLPYGAGMNKPKVRSNIADNQLIHVFWNVDSLDWQDKDPQSIFKRIVKQMEASSSNSGIILMHDIHPQTVVATRLLIDHLIKNKLILCDVQSVIDQMNGLIEKCSENHLSQR